MIDYEQLSNHVEAVRMEAKSLADTLASLSENQWDCKDNQVELSHEDKSELKAKIRSAVHNLLIVADELNINIDQ